jgi:rod shape-determining protein MreD
MTALQASYFGAMPSLTGDPWPRIEFLPLLAVFYAMYATEYAGPLAALLCGLMYDLRQGDYVGTSMIPLALVGWGIVRVRLSIFRENFVSQVVLTLTAIMAFALLAVTFRWAIGAPLEGRSAWTHLGYLAGNAVYTGILAPFIFWVFFRFQGMLGFTSHGPRGRGGHSWRSERES